MTVKAEKMPPARTLIGAVDLAAREAATAARKAAAPAVARHTPRKTGATQAALRPRTSRTKTGYRIQVAAPRGRRHPGSGARINEIIRWVQRGTGIYRATGPGPFTPIRPKSAGRARFVQTLSGAGVTRRAAALNVYGRFYRSVKGQKPNPFMARIERTAGPAVVRELQRGAHLAVRKVDRMLG